LELELVGDRADDRDAEAAFRELLPLERRRPLGVEALAVVHDLHGERVSAELVGDRDETGAARVRMADRVRDRLGQRELEVREQLLGEGHDVGEAAEGEARECDVLRPGGNAQPDGAHSFELLAFRLHERCFVHSDPRRVSHRFAR
jgi:hypothetical protein